MNKRTLYIAGAVLGIVVVLGGWLLTRPKPTQKASTARTTAPAAFNKKQYSHTEPASIWMVVNKQRPLPAEYVPADLVVPKVPLRLPADAHEMRLRREAAQALESLFADAKKAGYELSLASGYRSYSFQRSLYARYVAQDGQAAADRSSARAGHSEHQTGLGADIGRADRRCEIEVCFADTPEGKWVAKHAAGHGFIIRYFRGGQPRTGYEFEPWHLRYVGKALAAELAKQSSQTLESFFGLPAAADYK